MPRAHRGLCQGGRHRSHPDLRRRRSGGGNGTTGPLFAWLEGMRLLTAILVALVALTANALATNALAQEWPNRPLRFVVPFPAGGSTDALTRLLCERLT